MDITGNRPHPSARRFEAGTPAVVNCYASEAGLKFLLESARRAIEKRNQALTRRCMERLVEIGWPSVTPTQDERAGRDGMHSVTRHRALREGAHDGATS